MKATKRISPEAVENFCTLTGCKAKHRGGGRPKAKHWQFYLNGRRLFFVKENSSIGRMMELYDKAMSPPAFITFNSWVSDWKTCPDYHGKIHENLVQTAAAELDFGDLEARTVAWYAQGGLYDGGSDGRTVPDADRSSGHGDAGGHGVPAVRAIVVDSSGSGYERPLRGADEPTDDAARVAGSDQARRETEAEARYLATLPQEIQNALAMHSFIVRKLGDISQIGVAGPPRRWMVSVQVEGGWLSAIERAEEWLQTWPNFQS